MAALSSQAWATRTYWPRVASERYGLRHLVRGDRCCEREEWRQRLLDLGAAVLGQYFELQPCEALEIAFAAVGLRQDRRPLVVEV